MQALNKLVSRWRLNNPVLLEEPLEPMMVTAFPGPKHTELLGKLEKFNQDHRTVRINSGEVLHQL
jgi:hypothetical protein